MIGTNRKHLYRHFNGGRLVEDPKGMRDMEYLGYVATVEYDGQTYKTFVPHSFSDRLQPTFSELATYGIW